MPPEEVFRIRLFFGKRPSRRSNNLEVLGAFAGLRKATINFVMSVRQSSWNNTAPTGEIFMKFGIRVFLENLSRKFKFHTIGQE